MSGLLAEVTAPSASMVQSDGAGGRHCCGSSRWRPRRRRRAASTRAPAWWMGPGKRTWQVLSSRSRPWRRTSGPQSRPGGQRRGVPDDRGGRQMKYRPGGRYFKYRPPPGLSWPLDRACTATYRLWISEDSDGPFLLPRSTAVLLDVALSSEPRVAQRARIQRLQESRSILIVARAL